MPPSRKRRKAPPKGPPAKKQEHEGSEQEIEETTSGWSSVILASPALRERFRFPPTGPLGARETRDYSFTLWALLRSALDHTREIMRGAQDYAWPKNERVSQLQDDEDLGTALAELAVALADNDGWWHCDSSHPSMEAALTIVRKMLPKRAVSPSADPSFARVAFEREEIPDSTGVYPSYRLKQKLDKYIAKYYGAVGDSGYHSPYASIVGPSGSGKTFSVKQLADREGTYVVYTSLSQNNVSVPAQGAMAIFLHMAWDEKAFVSFWDRYLRVGVLLVELAQEHNISPGVLFRIQYHDDYYLFREDIARLVGNTTAKACTKSAVRKIIEKTVTFETLRGLETSAPGQQPSSDENGKTPIIFCFDEARALLHVHADDSKTTKANNGQPIAFRQLRHALARCGQDMFEKSTFQIFGVLLDTSSRVHNFSPPIIHDPSIKEGQSTNLFPPLYGIHTTWDGFAKRSPEVQSWLTTIIAPGKGSGSSGSSSSLGSIRSGPQKDNDWYRFFYSLGRPLWGAVLEASLQRQGAHNEEDGDSAESAMGMRLSEGIRAVGKLIRTKLTLKKAATVEERDYHHIALLLFRLQFYLSDHKLSETLVADWLHYVRHVSPDRSTIQTMQPSEPVLAQYVMHEMKASPSLREEMVQSLTKSLHYGALNVGDSGEIIAGLLLLLAADATPEGLSDQGIPAMHKSLASFLNTFVGWSPTPNPFLAQSRVHVTHLGRLSNKSAYITQRHLQVAFLTGEALYLSANFPGVDMLVPVWQGPDRPMTALLVQVKNKDGPTEITSSIRVQARWTLVSGRKQVEALNIDKGLTVYGLYLNIRPRPPLLAGTRAEELNPEPNDGNLPMFVKMGFDQETYPFLAPGECNAISGIVNSHIIDISEEETRNLAVMLDTRDGSTFADID